MPRLIDCFKKHNIPGLQAKYESSIKDGMSDAEKLSIATEIALEHHKELHNELNNLRAEVGVDAIEYVSPSTSEKVKATQEKFNKEIDAKKTQLAEENKKRESEKPVEAPKAVVSDNTKPEDQNGNQEEKSGSSKGQEKANVLKPQAEEVGAEIPAPALFIDGKKNNDTDIEDIVTELQDNKVDVNKENIIANIDENISTLRDALADPNITTSQEKDAHRIINEFIKIRKKVNKGTEYKIQSEKSTPKPKKENGIKEREIPKNDKSEHKDGDGTRKATETSNSNSTEQGRKEPTKEKEVAPKEGDNISAFKRGDIIERGEGDDYQKFVILGNSKGETTGVVKLGIISSDSRKDGRIEEMNAENNGGFTKVESTKEKEAGTTKVYHGADTDFTIEGKKNRIMFASKSKDYANYYAKQRSGKVFEFNVENSRIAKEEYVKDKIKKLNLKTESGDLVDTEDNLHRLIDPRFDDTSISKEGLDELFAELEKEGYYGVEFMDENQELGGMNEIESIAVFNPKELAKEKKVEQSPLQKLEKEYEDKTIPELSAIKKKLYGNVDIESPMSPEEKLLNSVIAKKLSVENQMVMDKRKAEEAKPTIITNLQEFKKALKKAIPSLGKKQLETLAIQAEQLKNFVVKEFGLSEEEAWRATQGEIVKSLEELGVGSTFLMTVNGKQEMVRSMPDVTNGFYSPLEKIIGETKFDKLPAKQWLDKFAKGEEAKWTGLTQWLQEKGNAVVSKQEIQTFLRDNRVQVVEVVKGGGRSEKEIVKEIEKEGYQLEGALGEEGYVILKDGEFAEYDELPSNVKKLYDELASVTVSDAMPTKFQQYQLAGEKENYREILVTMPVINTAQKNEADKERKRIFSKWEKEGITVVEARTKYPQDIIDLDKANKQLATAQPDAFGGNPLFKSKHFSEPNILVHLRMSDRVDSEGNKVLHISEIQSDWGQTGKREGFTEEIEKTKWKEPRDVNGNKVYDSEKGDFFIVDRGEGNVSLMNRDADVINDGSYKTVEDAKVAADGEAQSFGRNGIPIAPFVTDTNGWVKLALKTALKEAVKSGATKITWETGETQNERYDLSKSVDSIAYRKNEDGTYHVMAIRGDNRVLDEKSIPENKIEDYVGKEVAKRVINEEGEEAKAIQGKDTITLKELTGEQLKVGGSGMKGFYGSPTENSLGIVGNVAKSLFKQEPKTVEVKLSDNLNAPFDITVKDENGKITTHNFDSKSKASAWLSKEVSNGAKYEVISEKSQEEITSTQHSIDITPELRAQVEEGLPLFQNPNKSQNLQQIIDHAKSIITGTEVFKQFSQDEQLGLAKGGEIHAESSIILGANESANGQAESTNEEQENQIEKYAKERGVWVEDVNEKYGPPDNAGEESIVWVNPENQTVTKSQNTFLYGTLQEKLDSITLHNSLFPEAAIKVIGFGRNVDGDFQVIIEQPFIVADETQKITPSQIKEYMAKLGFENTEGTNYSNSQTIIEDLHTGNAILTPEGNIVIIDPIARLNTPEQGYGGTRKLGNISNDEIYKQVPSSEKQGSDNSGAGNGKESSNTQGVSGTVQSEQKNKNGVLDNQKQGDEVKGAANTQTQQTFYGKLADISTALHEPHHHFLGLVDTLASQGNIKAIAMQRTINQWTESKEGIAFAEREGLEMNSPIHRQELFARSAEKYFMEGKRAGFSERMNKVFAAFKTFLEDIYEGVINSPFKIQLSPEIRDLFDTIYGKEKTDNDLGKKVDSDIVKEIKSKKLSHVSGLSMGSNQADGTYISTEESNRYGEGKNTSTVEVSINNPLVASDGLIELRTKVLNDNKSEFDTLDFELGTPISGPFTIENLTNSGNKKLATLVTRELKSQGYDSIYFPESNTQEGELVVFDKNKVKINIQNEQPEINQIAVIKPIEDQAKNAEDNQDKKEAQQVIDKIDVVLLNNMSKDQQARLDGQKVVEGQVVKRQGKINAIIGKAVDVLFSKQVKQPAKYAVVEREDLQPSHKSGVVNSLHFIPEAQPRDRGALAVLKNEAKAKSDKLDPGQLADNNIAYYGSPIINERGEVIQGNGRAEAIDFYYQNDKEDSKGYREMVKAKAKELGISEEALANMKEPVLVRMAEVNDEEAIILGNYTSSDLEDAKQKGADAKGALNRLTDKDLKEISDAIGNKISETETLKSAIRDNAKFLIDLLMEKGALRGDMREQYFNKDGVTPEGIEDTYNILRQFLFEGGRDNLSSLFDNLNFTQRSAIENTIPAIISNREFRAHVQNVIEILYEKEDSGTKAFDTWAKQMDMFKGKIPIEIFNSEDMELARRIDEAKPIKVTADNGKVKTIGTQGVISMMLIKIAQDMNGSPEVTDLFGVTPAVAPKSFNEAMGIEAPAKDRMILNGKQNIFAPVNEVKAPIQEEVNPDNGILVLPSDRADEAESNLVIVQSRKYYTLWLKLANINGKGFKYTYLTTLSTDVNEARFKAQGYINDIAKGKKLSVAFNGKNTADIGSRKTIALNEQIETEKDLEKIEKILPVGLDSKIGFGKYSQSTIGEVIQNDINYASWLVDNARDPKIREAIKQHPSFQQIADIKELERERVSAFEEREAKREQGEIVPVSTLVRGEDGVIKEVVEETKAENKAVDKLEKRVVKDQIKDIIAPNTKAIDRVRERLKKFMFPSQVDGANTAIQSMEDNGVVLNGDGAGVGKTRQIVAVADYYAKQGKPVIIISENAALGKPWDKAGKSPQLGGSMEKDSKEMGLELKLLDGEVKDGSIYVSTYNRVKESDIPEGAVVIFDEAHNLVNTFGRTPGANEDTEEKQWEIKFKAILNKIDKVAYYSATPADKPHQLAYLHKILGFNTADDFLNQIVLNGGVIKTRKFGREEFKYYDVPSSPTQRKKLYDWVNGLMVKAGEDGKFIKREISYEGTDVQFHSVSGIDEAKNPFAKYFNEAIADMEDAQKREFKLLAPNSYILYAAELAKIGDAIKIAKREKEAGRKVILFVSRIKPMEIRGKRKMNDGSWGDPQVVGEIPSPVDILKKELEKEGISFVELHGSAKTSSQKAQKEFEENADALVASLESGGTGINLDDTTGKLPRTEIFMFSPYRGISTIQGMGRIWRASTLQNDNKPNRYVFITAPDIAPDIARSGVLAKKLQLMDAAIGGTAVSKLPMSNVNYDVKQLVGVELPDEGEESSINKVKTGVLKPVDIEFKKSAKGNFYAPANADILEWVERGGPERTGLPIRVFKGDNGWVALADREYQPEEFAPEGINGEDAPKTPDAKDDGVFFQKPNKSESVKDLLKRVKEIKAELQGMKKESDFILDDIKNFQLIRGEDTAVQGVETYANMLGRPDLVEAYKKEFKQKLSLDAMRGLLGKFLANGGKINEIAKLLGDEKIPLTNRVLIGSAIKSLAEGGFISKQTSDAIFTKYTKQLGTDVSEALNAFRSTDEAPDAVVQSLIYSAIGKDFEKELESVNKTLDEVNNGAFKDEELSISEAKVAELKNEVEVLKNKLAEERPVVAETVSGTRRKKASDKLDLIKNKLKEKYGEGFLKELSDKINKIKC